MAKQIAVGLVSSKLDKEKDITRLQRVKNCLVRVVAKAPRSSRYVCILKRLHWLSVKFRIAF